MIADERKRSVQAAYDALGPRFGEWDERVEGDPWERFLEELAARLPTRARVLDLGCGNGRKIARLTRSFELVAVDISEGQLRLARAKLPRATLVNGDLSELDFAAHSFDAVTALYSIMHVPRANRLLVREAGFELVLDELVWMREPQREVAFLWVLARKRT